MLRWSALTGLLMVLSGCGATESAERSPASARAATPTMPAPPPRAVPPVAVEPTGTTARFVPRSSGPRGTVRLPASGARGARMTLRRLDAEAGFEYGLWLLGDARKPRFLGLIPLDRSATTASLLFPLPETWRSYDAAVLTEERERRPTEPGRRVARAPLP